MWVHVQKSLVHGGLRVHTSRTPSGACISHVPWVFLSDCHLPDRRMGSAAHSCSQWGWSARGDLSHNGALAPAGPGVEGGVIGIPGDREGAEAPSSQPTGFSIMDPFSPPFSEVQSSEKPPPSPALQLGSSTPCPVGWALLAGNHRLWCHSLSLLPQLSRRFGPPVPTAWPTLLGKRKAPALHWGPDH